MPDQILKELATKFDEKKRIQTLFSEEMAQLDGEIELLKSQLLVITSTGKAEDAPKPKTKKSEFPSERIKRFVEKNWDILLPEHIEHLKKIEHDAKYTAIFLDLNPRTVKNKLNNGKLRNGPSDVRGPGGERWVDSISAVEYKLDADAKAK